MFYILILVALITGLIHNLEILGNIMLTQTAKLPCLATAVCCLDFFSAFNFGIPLGYKSEVTHVTLRTHDLPLTKLRLKPHTDPHVQRHAFI